MLKNPDNKQRGCFIDPITTDPAGECQVVDYPTYRARRGQYVTGANMPIPEGTDYTCTFASRAEAVAFCEKENYVICSSPGAAEEQ